MIPAVLPALGLASRAGIGAFAISKGVKKAKSISVEMYGYDFVGLIMKLLVYFVVAYFVEKYIWWSQLKPINQILAGIFGAIGGLPLFALSPTILKFFDNAEVNRGVKFWDIIKGGAVALVAWEAWNYHKNQEMMGGKASPMTLGIFALIGGLLGFMAVPDLLKKVQEMAVLNQPTGV